MSDTSRPSFECSVADLSNAVKLCARVAPMAAKFPILSSLRMGSTAGGLTLRATDLDCDIQVWLESPGCPEFVPFCVPAARLAAAVGSLPPTMPAQVTAPADGAKSMTLECGVSRFVFQAASDEDYPPDVSLQSLTRFTVQAGVLLSALRTVSVAASTDASRAILQSVCFRLSLNRSFGDQLELWSTDGRRLHRCSSAAEAVTQPSAAPEGPLLAEAVVPSAGVRLLERTLGVWSPETTVEVALSSAYLALDRTWPKIAMRLVEGAYPNTAHVVPPASSLPHAALIDAKVWIDAVRRLSTAMDGDGKAALRIEFFSDTAKLSIAGALSQTFVNAGHEVVPISPHTDAQRPTGQSVGLNPNCLRDALASLGALSSDPLIFRLGDSRSPCRIDTPCGKATAVIMPVVSQ